MCRTQNKELKCKTSRKVEHGESLLRLLFWREARARSLTSERQTAIGGAGRVRIRVWVRGFCVLFSLARIACDVGVP